MFYTEVDDPRLLFKRVETLELAQDLALKVGDEVLAARMRRRIAEIHKMASGGLNLDSHNCPLKLGASECELCDIESTYGAFVIHNILGDYNEHVYAYMRHRLNMAMERIEFPSSVIVCMKGKQS